jgi:lipopolysaccharide export system ATP-binding protein
MVNADNDTQKNMNSSESPRGSGPDVPLLKGGVLELLGLSHYYGRKLVLDKLSLSVRRGEIIGLLGPNGAGKTTVMRLAAGLIKSEIGNVYINGRDTTQMRLSARARLGLGYLPQESSVFRRLSVSENLELALQERGFSSLARLIRREEALKRLDLISLANREAESLSGGERRRLEIARALALEPLVLILDEPFAGLDPIAIERLIGHLKELAQDGIGILITDHNIRDTLKICDSATILLGGATLVNGMPQVIAADAMTREHFLGKDFRLDT